MKRRIVLEIDDTLTTAEMTKIGGCEDVFGLSSYVCRSRGDDELLRDCMAEFGITVLSDERIE